MCAAFSMRPVYQPRFPFVRSLARGQRIESVIIYA